MASSEVNRLSPIPRRITEYGGVSFFLRIAKLYSGVALPFS